MKLLYLALAAGAQAFAPSAMRSRALRAATPMKMAGFDMEASIQETKVGRKACSHEAWGG